MENGNICTTPLSNKTCTGEEIIVTVDRTKPSSGTITINKGEIEKARNLYIDKKYINKDYNNEIVLSDEKIEVLCTAATELSIQKYSDLSDIDNYKVLEEQTGVLASEAGSYAYGVEYTCDVGDGESKTFYVLEDGDTTTLTEGRIAQPGEVSLIMNMNIDLNGKNETSVNNISWISQDDYLKLGGVITEEMKNDGGWCGEEIACGGNQFGPITANNYLKEATKNWTKLNESQISLPTGEQISIAGGDIEWTVDYSKYYTTNIELSKWLWGNMDSLLGHSTGYWTSTPFKLNNIDAWFIGNCYNNGSNNYYGCLCYRDVAYYYWGGVRPVITILKTQLG